MTQNPLWDDIQAQGENLLRVVEHLYGQERKRIEGAAGLMRADRPTALIGMGSSLALSIPAAYLLEQYGRYASVIAATDALYSVMAALRGANVVLNSRSGETAEIVKLVAALNEAGIGFVAITNEPESTLAKAAARVVWSNSRNDDLVSINVATAMMTTTLAFAAAAVGQMDAVRADVERAAGAVAEVAQRAWDASEGMLELFREVRPIYLLARGASKGASSSGRLVLEEVARWPAVAMDAGDFRQGPIEVVDGRFGAVMFAGSGRQGGLNRVLADNIRASGGKVMMIGGADGFALPEVSDVVRPVLEVIPMQVLAYRLAESQEYVPGTMRYIAKVITSEEGSPK